MPYDSKWREVLRRDGTADPYAIQSDRFTLARVTVEGVDWYELWEKGKPSKFLRAFETPTVALAYAQKLENANESRSRPTPGRHRDSSNAGQESPA